MSGAGLLLSAMNLRHRDVELELAESLPPTHGVQVHRVDQGAVHIEEDSCVHDGSRDCVAFWAAS
jgi:hypothetical protein